MMAEKMKQHISHAPQAHIEPAKPVYRAEGISSRRHIDYALRARYTLKRSICAGALDMRFARDIAPAALSRIVF